MEELLSTKDFVRISNSAIININHVKCFNTSIIGKIIVKFKDGSEEVVSKRRTKEIMKFLKDRFIMDIPVGVLVDSLSYMNPDSEELIEMGNKYQESLEIYIPAIQEKKELYGDDYPAEALLIYQVINWFQIRDIVKVYLISLLIVVILGTIMYIVVLQKTQKKQMIIELIIAFAIFVSVMKILNVGYGIVINKVIQSIDAKSAEAYVDNNINTSTLMIIYGIIAVGIYIVNMIRQKITTKELNKELNNK